jgi:YVTN family beta-propeller protein
MFGTIRIVALWAAFVTLTGCSGATGLPERSRAPTGRPDDAASDQVRVYVSNERSNDVSVIDPATNRVIATIPVGKRPRGLQLSRDGRTLYVALSGSPIGGPHVKDAELPPADKAADGIGVIDLATGRMTGKLVSGSDPEQFALGVREPLAYIANEDVGRATVMDLRDGSVVATLKVGYEPEGVAISPDGRWVYVTGESSNSVHVIDTASNAVAAEIKTAARPRSAAFTPDGAKAYVTCENDGTVDVVDVAARTVVKSIPLRHGPDDELVRPMGVVLSPDGSRAYVTTGRGKSVAVIDTVGERLMHTIPDVGERPWGVGITPDGKTLYTANGPSNDVSVIDTGTLAVTSRVPAGTSPWGIVVSGSLAPWSSAPSLCGHRLPRGPRAAVRTVSGPRPRAACGWRATRDPAGPHRHASRGHAPPCPGPAEGRRRRARRPGRRADRRGVGLLVHDRAARASVVRRRRARGDAAPQAPGGPAVPQGRRQTGS